MAGTSTDCAVMIELCCWSCSPWRHFHSSLSEVTPFNIQHLFCIVMQFVSYPLELHTLQPNKTALFVYSWCCQVPRWDMCVTSGLLLTQPSYSWFSSMGEKSCKLVRAVSHIHHLTCQITVSAVKKKQL